MSDPTAIQLDEDDVEQIITKADAQRGLPFLVEVTGSPIRFSHEKATADRGAELSPGQTHTLSNLRGKAIYVTPRGGSAEIRVRPAGANVETQPPKGVSVEGDVNIGSKIDIEDDQTREVGKIRVQESDGTLVDPATESTLSTIQTQTSDVATESTLSTIQSQTSDVATQTTLAAILTELEEQTAILQEIETNTSA